TDKSGYIELTPQIQDELKAHRDRTRVGGINLLKNAGNVPDGLTHSVVNSWLYVNVDRSHRTVRIDHLNFVLKAWSSLPDYSHELVCLDPETVERLRTYHQNTDILIPDLLKIMPGQPDGLRADMVHQWMSGKYRNVRQDHLEFVLKAWARVPQYEFVTITPEILDRLRDYKDQTGLGPMAILRGTRGRCPKGLRADHIKTWLKGTNKKVRKEHLEFVLYQWKMLLNEGQGRIDLSDDTIEQLKSHRDRSGVYPGELLRKADNIPKGLNAGIIAGWLERRALSAKKEHVEFILDLWSKQVDREMSNVSPKSWGDSAKGWTVLDDRIIKTLRTYMEQTNVSGTKLLKNASDVPKGLTIHIIHSALNGGSKFMRTAHLEFLLKEWQSVPEDLQRIKITDDIARQLKRPEDEIFRVLSGFVM
ncbi:MAG: hypothetical protein MI749_15935, partial [Desulfovibrionales bacterium]|nr:hypothetical protein [Desulfovibrionales bacterium]